MRRWRLETVSLTRLKQAPDLDILSQEMCQIISKLYPICRSITGNGVRHTLHLIQEDIPLTIHVIPSGTPVFDWSVPKEWNIRDAYVRAHKVKKS
jgi:aminopeptidase-like protein